MTPRAIALLICLGNALLFGGVAYWLFTLGIALLVGIAVFFVTAFFLGLAAAS